MPMRKPLPLIVRRYYGWFLETDEGQYPNCSERELHKAVAGVGRGTLGFAILTPPQPVSGCDFLQFCLDDRGKFHLEYCFPDAERANLLRFREGISGTELKSLLSDFLEKGWIPDTSRWETAGSFADAFDRSIYEEILRRIGGEAAVRAFDYALVSPRGWYHEHEAAYAARGIPVLAGNSTLLWYGMADHLLAGGCLVELEEKPPLETFLGAVRHLAGTLPVEEDWFDPKHSLPRWCAMLDRKWWDTGCCVGAYGLDGHSYVLFVTSRTELGHLRDLAAKLGQRIDLAKLL